MTSWEVIVSLIGTPSGIWSELISRLPFVCSMCHIHCFPITKISVAFGGGCEFLTKISAPQKYMMTTRIMGMTVHVTSSGILLITWFFGGGSSGERRRYLMAK